MYIWIALKQMCAKRIEESTTKLSFDGVSVKCKNHGNIVDDRVMFIAIAALNLNKCESNTSKALNENRVKIQMRCAIQFHGHAP